MIRSYINGKPINHEISVLIEVNTAEIVALCEDADGEGLSLTDLLVLKGKEVDFSLGGESVKMIVRKVNLKNEEGTELKYITLDKKY